MIEIAILNLTQSKLRLRKSVFSPNFLLAKHLRGTKMMILPDFLFVEHTVWKIEKFTVVTQHKFRQINSFVFSLLKTLLSRNFCQRSVTVNFHTVRFENIFREKPQRKWLNSKLSLGFFLSWNQDKWNVWELGAFKWIVILKVKGNFKEFSNIGDTQCKIFLPLRFYVKSLLA